MNPDVHYARSGDVALAYQVVGDGPRDLLVLMGFLSNLEYAWRIPSLAAFLGHLAEGSRLILVDRRGSGLSDGYGDPPPIETALEDLEIVLDEVGSPRTRILGVWGGALEGVLFAATRPERVSGLLMFGASPTQLYKDDFPWAWTEQEYEAWLADLRLSWGTRSWVVRNARWMGPSLLDDPEELEHWISYVRLSATPTSAEAVMRQWKAIDVRHALPAVQCPTLILHRTGDQIEDVESGRYMAARIPGARLVELAGDDGMPWLGDTDHVLQEIDDFLGGQGSRAIAPTRRLATVKFTDIVGSTENLTRRGDAGWREVLAEHDRRCADVVMRHGGTVVAHTGDGLVATFDGPSAAVRAACEIPESVAPLDVQVRAGVHTGEIEMQGEQIRGIAVHVGARVAALADAGEVLVTSTVVDLSAGSGLAFDDVGHHELKGVPGHAHLYRAAVHQPARPAKVDAAPGPGRPCND